MQFIIHGKELLSKHRPSYNPLLFQRVAIGTGVSIKIENPVRNS